MKILTERTVVHILKSVVLGRFLGIRIDLKCLLNVILGRFLGIRSDLKCLSKCHFVEILTDIFFPTICRFGEIFWDQKQPKMLFLGDFWGSELTDRKCLSKCHFGEILTDIFFYNLSFLGIFPKKNFGAPRRTWKKSTNIVILERFQHFNICHFWEISG